MRAFLRRRSAAATEALLFAVIVTVVTAGAGLSAVAEPGIASSQTTLDQASQREQVLDGVLVIEPTGEQADGVHWTATLQTGDRTVSVRITHEDSHRVELMGAHVQVQGTWSADGTFLADAIDPVDPSAVALGDESLGKPPATVVPAGKQKTIDGVLSFRHGDDFDNGRATPTHYFLATAAGETELVYAHAPAGDLAGAKVRVTGVTEGKRLFVADGATRKIAAATTAASYSTGTRRVAVVLLNFSNDTSQPYTKETARGVAFTNPESVAAYYAESSWGQLALTGDVFGWYTIPNTNTSCAYSTWASAANTAASAAGVDLSAFDNVVYAFPTTASCPWGGLAQTPGRSTWLNGPGSMALRTMAHELGHNFGTHHASSLECTEGGVRVSMSSSATNCSTYEYGDPFTLMGQATRYQHTNFSRGNFGWLQSANTATVSVSGDYVLKPIETGGSSANLAIQIARTSGTYLTLEVRQVAGFDTFLDTAPVVNGISVRITSGYNVAAQSQLVDSTPGTSSFVDAPIQVGQTLVDPVSGVSIKTVGVSSAGVIVHIQFGSVPTPTPTPSATPLTSPTAIPTPSPTPIATPTPSPTPVSDTQPPTAPATLLATFGTGKRLELAWTASTDNVGVVGYNVYRDGVRVGTVTGTSFGDTFTGKRKSATYGVVAYDLAGNLSATAQLVLAAP